MRHIQITLSHRRAQTVQDINRCNGASGRGVGSFRELVLCNQSTNRLEVWAGNDGNAIRFKHPKELSKGKRHFVGVKVLYVVRGEDGID